jgi:hypothetical protein
MHLNNQLIRTFILSILVFGLAACQTDSPEKEQRKARSEQEINSAPAFEAVNFPDVSYQLGAVDYRTLLLEAIEQNGSQELAKTFKDLMTCRDHFEKGEGNTAFVKTLTILGENWPHDLSALSETEKLLLSDIIYQASRSFFYERNEIFNPTCALVEQGVTISKSLIHSKNELIQQVALFQLARHFDVLEGLTNHYAQITSILPEDQLLFASSNSLHIKRKLLGLKGGSVLRSLHNFRMDQRLLCDQGKAKNCSMVSKLEEEAFEQFKYLSWQDRKEYSEFYMVAICHMVDNALKNENPKLAKAAIEKGLALLTNREGYTLEGPLPTLSPTEGALIHPSMPTGLLQKYIAYTESDVYKPLLKHITDQMISLSAESFEKAERSNAIVYDDISDLEKYQTQNPFQNEFDKLTGPAAFQYLSKLHKSHSYQQNELRLRTNLAKGSNSYKRLFHKTYSAENQLREDELKLTANVSPKNL